MKSRSPSQIKQVQKASALLSFLLPGLGQVYLLHYRRGLALFAAFSLVICFPEVRGLLPVAAFLVAAEAYRLARSSTRFNETNSPAWLKKLLTQRVGNPKVRTGAYAVVAALGFFNWFMLFVGVLYPMDWQLRMGAQGDEIAERVRSYASTHGGQLPTDLGQVLGGKNLVRDPWGGHIEVAPVAEGFVVHSNGKDRKSGTSDDIVYSYRFHPAVTP